MNHSTSTPQTRGTRTAGKIYPIIGYSFYIPYLIPMNLDRRMLIFSAVLGMMYCPVTWAAPFASTRMTVTVRGEGPDVILIPGLAASRDVWNGTVAAIPGYRYHMIQIAGFAGHPVGGNANGPVAAPVAAEIARYIQEQKLRNPAIIGHSMGGAIAMMLASRWPGRVGRVMIVDMVPAPAAAMDFATGNLLPWADRLTQYLTGSDQGRQALNNVFSLFVPPTATGGTASPKSDASTVTRAANDMARMDLRPELSRIKVPMTVVYATVPGARYDTARVAQIYKAQYATAKSAKLTQIQGSGHMIMFDQPARFRAQIKHFMTTP